MPFTEVIRILEDAEATFPFLAHNGARFAAPSMQVAWANTRLLPRHVASAIPVQLFDTDTPVTDAPMGRLPSGTVINIAGKSTFLTGDVTFGADAGATRRPAWIGFDPTADRTAMGAVYGHLDFEVMLAAPPSLSANWAAGMHPTVETWNAMMGYLGSIRSPHESDDTLPTVLPANQAEGYSLSGVVVDRSVHRAGQTDPDAARVTVAGDYTNSGFAQNPSVAYETKWGIYEFRFSLDGLPPGVDVLRLAEAIPVPRNAPVVIESIPAEGSQIVQREQGRALWAELQNQTTAQDVVQAGDDIEVVDRISGEWRVRAGVLDVSPGALMYDSDRRLWTVTGMDRESAGISRLNATRIA
ncbi:MAG: hypothetical protein OXJ90_08830 [Spirochaetaceae bacterium]|nr:hypothetical protein [Spirochaetaceae bacterium]